MITFYIDDEFGYYAQAKRVREDNIVIVLKCITNDSIIDAFDISDAEFTSMGFKYDVRRI